ncbi:MAG: hypothetical protein NC548_26545 [Lachnospiraceae bacterium]|nr:hypothetical protein [Lachnospiraceae bacterium]
MGRYYLDTDEKRIVRSLVRLEDKRRRGKLKRRETAFDRKVQAAIERADSGVDLGGVQGEQRAELLAKIHDHIVTNTPWERIGETYCSRGTFYAYARRYQFLIAQNVGLVGESSGRKGNV